MSASFLFEWRNTDNSAAHFVSFVHIPQTRAAFLQVGWDDGIVVRLGNRVVFDKSNYPPRGKGILYHDKHQFEVRVPVKLEKGASRLSVLSLNLRGAWIFALRITDEQDLPIDGLQFRLE